MLIDPDALESLKRSHPRLYKRVVEPGIGVDIGGGVKCLHLHLADYLSGANPTGEEVYLLLKHRGVSTDCDEGRVRVRGRRRSAERGKQFGQVARGTRGR